MKRAECIGLRLIFTVFIIVTMSLQGCVSLQIPARDGKPELIGVGSARQVGGTNGQVYQIIAPGLSLRAYSSAPGLSLGWHETRLLYPTGSGGTNASVRPVAVQTKCFGMDLAPAHVMLGFDNTFAIPLPEQGKDVIQFIGYSENNPTNTVVEKKEIK